MMAHDLKQSTVGPQSCPLLNTNGTECEPLVSVERHVSMHLYGDTIVIVGHDFF